MNVNIKTGIANGEVIAPPSKSMAHRYMILAGLANGKSEISNIKLSQDVLATMDCLNALGINCSYDEKGEKLTVYGNFDIETNKISKSEDEELVLPCRECGSTIRFMIPVAMMTGRKCLLTGSKRLMERPMTVYGKICEDQNISYLKDDKGIHICGLVQSGVFEIKGNISSQFITGLLFILPLLKGDSIIRLIPPVESRSYINMTLQALNTFGIKVTWKSENELFIQGNQQVEAKDVFVEGDYSNAAFLDGFNYLGNEDENKAVKVNGLFDESLQGDRVYRSHFETLKNGYADIDLSDCPDLGPVLFAVAACNNGAHFTGTKRLKIKESDRVLAMKQELAKLGVVLEDDDNEVIVKACKLKTPDEIIDGHSDHRIVMAMALLLSRTGGTIRGCEAVNKSFPDFFEYMSACGIEVNKDGMDK